MPVANLVVRIAADIADFEKKISGVERSLSRTGRNLENIGSRLTKGLTLPLAAGLGVVSKAAIDFESSFAGIRKTVNATESEFASLSKGMRDMAKTIPVNVNELNKIGEAAGQLGIKTGNILEFTKVMAKLGVTTNLSSDQAATSLARFANIVDQTKVAAGTFEFDRLGSTIVALGNNFATTEAEIVDFGLRIAGAGKIAGLTESQILAIGTAMSSVGVEAEAGGTAVQKVLNSMTEAVATGGKALEQFAATSGQSAQQFADAFRDDAGQAFARFVAGLQAEGDQAFTTLDNLKLGNERVIRAFLSLANAGDLLTNALRVGGEAWSENAALTREAEERFKTTASQLLILKNNLQDAAITLGQAFLPIINDLVQSSKPMVQSLADMATAFKELPKGVQTTAFALAGVLISIGPLTYAAGAITNAFGGLVKAFRFFIPEVSLVAVKAGDASKVFSGFLGTIGRFAGPLALLAGGLYAVKQAYDAFNESTEEGVKSVLSIIPGIGLLNTALDVLADKFPRLQAVMEDIASIVRSSMILAWRELGKAFDQVRAAFATTIDVIANQFQPVLDAFGVKWENVVRVFNGVVIPAIKGIAAAFLVSIPPIRDFLFVLSKVPGFGEIEQALDDVAKSMERMVADTNDAKSAVVGMGVVFKSAGTAADTWSSVLDSAGKSLTAASIGAVSFGPKVQTGVVKPLKLGGEAADDFSKKLKALKDDINGVDIAKEAKLWAAALKDTGAQVRVLADTQLRQRLLGVLDSVVAKFGSLKAAGLDALTTIHDKVRGLPFLELNLNLDGFLERLDLAARKLPQIRNLALDVSDAFGAFTPRNDIIGLSLEFSGVTLPSPEEMLRSVQALGERARNGLRETWTGMLDDVSRMLSSLASAFENAFGRVLAGAAQVVQGIDNIARSVTKLDAISSTIDLGVKIGKQLQPLLGLNRGLLGRLLGTNNQGVNDVQAFAKTFAGGFDEIHARLAEMGAEGDRLWRSLTQLNNAWDTEEAARAIANVERALEEFGTEAERAQKRLEALGVAVTGVNRKAELFAAPFQKLTDAIKDAEGAELDSLTQKLQATAQAGQAEFERLGIFAAAAFAGIVKETGDAIGALSQLAPALSVLQRGVDEFGLTTTGTIDRLLELFGLVNDAVTGPIFESIQATGQIFTGLQDAGILTAELFQTIATDIGAAFRELEAKGVDVSTAMALSQPVLQKLWEGQKIYGEITDETTRKILKQAEEQGLVGDHMKDVNQKILDVLILIAEVFGVTIPNAIRGIPPVVDSEAEKIKRKMDEAAKASERSFRDSADGIATHFRNIRIDPVRIDIEYHDPGFVPSVEGEIGVPKLASGGIVRRPTLALVGEAGPEAVVPLSHLSTTNIAPESVTSTFILEMDGRKVAQATVPHIPGEVRRLGLVPNGF